MLNLHILEAICTSVDVRSMRCYTSRCEVHPHVWQGMLYQTCKCFSVWPSSHFFNLKKTIYDWQISATKLQLESTYSPKEERMCFLFGSWLVWFFCFPFLFDTLYVKLLIYNRVGLDLVKASLCYPAERNGGGWEEYRQGHELQIKLEGTVAKLRVENT